MIDHVMQTRGSYDIQTIIVYAIKHKLTDRRVMRKAPFLSWST